MEAQHGHSAACCNIPPIQVDGYSGKGKWETFSEFETYVTGPTDSTKAILFIYDIFGKDFPQTIQGADILASSGTEQKYQVFMPDWFKGKPADISWYPPDTEEKKNNLGNFFQTTGSPGNTVPKVPDALKAIQSSYPNIKEWGVVGFCWGGKVTSILTSSESTIFKAAAECHPAMVDPSEATKIKIPMCMLASKDEPVEDVKKFKDNLTGPNHVETFGDQIHGWMTARSDLKDNKVKAEYERGYATLVEFFNKHL